VSRRYRELIQAARRALRLDRAWLGVARPRGRADLAPARAAKLSWGDGARIKYTGDQQIRRGPAPARPRAATPRPRPDRPGVRTAAGRRGARPRRKHVSRAPQPRVPGRIR